MHLIDLIKGHGGPNGRMPDTVSGIHFEIDVPFDLKAEDLDALQEPPDERMQQAQQRSDELHELAQQTGAPTY